MRSEFMIERQGKTFCLYAGLLDEAHQQGLKEIRTTLLQIPSPENGNMAICQSQVTTEKGTFTGLGDASPDNVARVMSTCLIRMAETRAKARALRDAVNVGVVALEELGADEGNGEHSEAGDYRSARNNGAHRGTSARSEQRWQDSPARGFEGRPAESAGRSSEGRADESAARSYEPARSSRPAAPVRAEEGPSDGITPAQRRMLLALAEQAGETVEADSLTRQQASQMISDLKNRLQARAA